MAASCRKPETNTTYCCIVSTRLDCGDNKALEEQIMPRMEIDVDARPDDGYWTNTGIQVSDGSQIKVSYISGKWKTNPHWSVDDARGNAAHAAPASYLLPGAPEGAMVAKVGGGIGWGDRGKAVYLVGNGASIPDSKSGTLFLGTNDEEQGFGDNTGTIRVRIEY